MVNAKTLAPMTYKLEVGLGVLRVKTDINP